MHQFAPSLTTPLPPPLGPRHTAPLCSAAQQPPRLRPAAALGSSLASRAEVTRWRSIAGSKRSRNRLAQVKLVSEQLSYCGSDVRITCSLD